MAERPSGRVTVRELAARAGCDPALVSYYFGSKDGLLAAALEDAVAQVRRVLETVTERRGSLSDQVSRLVRDPILELGRRPHVPRMLVEQVLLEPGPRADRFIAALGLPYLRAVEAIAEDGVRSGAFRAVDARALVYSLAAIPLFFFLMSPVIERVLGEEAVSPEAVEGFADAVADLVLHGLVAENRPAGPPGRS